MFEQITGLVNLIFSPITVFPAHIAITIFAVIITVLILGLNRIITKKELMNELKEKMEEIRENLTKAQKEGNKAEVEKYITELMRMNTKFMKHSLKSMMVAIIVAFIFLPWVNYRYSGMVVSLPFSIPFVGSGLSGIYWYVLVAVAISWVINKLLGG